MLDLLGSAVRPLADAPRRRAARALVVDDGSVLDAAWRDAVAAEPRVVVAGETSDLDAAVARAAATDASVVVVAQSDCTPETIRPVAEATAVVVVTRRRDPAYVRAMLESGARGFVLHDDGQLGRAVRDVADGGAYFTPEIANLLREGFLDGATAATPDGTLARLDETERAVLRGLVDGHPRDAIARRLRLSPDEVDAHRRRILELLAPASGRRRA
jgi:DNA-binding NarL/FixJ family response regulator